MRLIALQESVDPEKAKQLKKEIAKNQLNLERQAVADHQLEVQSQLFKGGLKTQFNELNQISGGIIKESHVATDMKEFKDHLEEVNGGPLVRDVYMQCELEMADKELDCFDLYEIE